MKTRYLITFLVLTFIQTIHAQQIYKKEFTLMGCDFGVTIVEKDSVLAEKYIALARNEMARIEKVISSWDPNSETSKINNNAGEKPVVVSEELYLLIERSIRISKLTDGAFDISFASIDKLWKFDGSMTNVPSKESIKESIKNIDFNNIELNPEIKSVYLRKRGMKIGFGAIGKGYAADKAKALLISKGVKAGIINASGDLNTWGKQPDGTDWVVAITNPLNKENAFAILPLKNNAVVTSGNYEKFIVIDGVRYAHIINPKTGYPTKGVLSATVFAPTAEIADALATSIFVLGIDIGLHRINQLRNIECIVIDDKGKVFTSQNININ
ncbi:MAG: FAD:protein FMN transferase [Flavobacteriales bacterium]